MASIETYNKRIDALKTSIETLKGGDKTLTIQNLPGMEPLVVRDWDDFDFPVGTVIAGDGAHAYMRVPHGATFWVMSSRTDETVYFGPGELYDHLREQAAAGEQFRIVHQPSA